MAPKRKRKMDSAVSVDSRITEISGSATKRHSNSQFVVNVGGTKFITSKDTLVAGSPFFAAMLSGKFAEGEDGEEVYVDRNPVPFTIILEYMRSNILLCGRENSTLLAAVLVEADFYGMDGLVYDVKLQCYTNLHHSTQTRNDAELLAKLEAEFPSVQDLVRHQHFPSIYYEKRMPNKIISKSPLPNNIYVEIGFFDVSKSRLQALEMIMFERGNEVITEPMIRLESKFIGWASIDFDLPIERWQRGMMKWQLVPVSFYTKAMGLGGVCGSWELLTREFTPLSDSKLQKDIVFTIRTDTAELADASPDYVELLTYHDTRISARYHCYTADMSLMEISKTSDFVSFGDKKLSESSRALENF
jgi:hypothetical protein